VKRFLFIALLAAACACQAVNVGIFDGTRLYESRFDVQSGASMTTWRGLWEARGGVWQKTTTLTPQFLSGVSVFLTSSISTTWFTTDEQAAVVSWVKGGGTLIVTGDCLCTGADDAYNQLLNGFGASMESTGWHDYGPVLKSTRVTLDLTQVFIAGGGFLTVPDDATKLWLDSLGYVSGAVMEGVSEVGAGRLLVTGDTDMFTNPYLTSYPENARLADAIAAWAIGPFTTIAGNVSVADYIPGPAGVPVTLKLYQSGTLADVVKILPNASGAYTASVLSGGVSTAVAKPPHWLALKQTVDTSAPFTANWDFQNNGDADNSNSIGFGDLGTVLSNFGTTGATDGDLNGDGAVGLSDLGIVLLGFGLAGEQGP